MRTSALLMILALGAGATVHSADEPPTPSVPAVWKQHKLDFVYFGRTSRYSCLGMRDKVRALMLDVGVRNDLKIQMYGCEIDRIRLRDISPGLILHFSAPQPADHADGQGKPFDAHYVTFDFRQDPLRNLNIGDCELVEEFARQVLPLLSTRNLKKDITCVPYQQSGSVFRVSGEVLVALPGPDEGHRKRN